MIFSIILFIKLINSSFNSFIIFDSNSPCNSRVMSFPSSFLPTSLLQFTRHFHALHPSITLHFFKDILLNKFILHHHYTYKYIIQTTLQHLLLFISQKNAHIKINQRYFLFHYTKTIQNSGALCVD
jgi:hypothetical protein